MPKKSQSKAEKEDPGINKEEPDHLGKSATTAAVIAGVTKSLTNPATATVVFYTFLKSIPLASLSLFKSALKWW